MPSLCRFSMSNLVCHAVAPRSSGGNAMIICRIAPVLLTFMMLFVSLCCILLLVSMWKLDNCTTVVE